jgi:nucleotide-binding universal stress UspA family protein
MLIAHTTDLSGTDEVAFEHAVALAERSGSRLVSIHACTAFDDKRKLPPAGELLARWGLTRALDHERIQHQCCDDAADTLLDALLRLKPDLLVSATHARTGLERILRGSVAEGVARNVPVPTLLLPLEGRRIVDSKTGRVALERVLIPAGTTEEAQRAIDAAHRLAKLAGVERLEILLLHVDEGGLLPLPVLPAGYRLTRCPARGALDAAILEVAQRLDASALVMTTRGHDSFGDVLFGSHTERVLHQCRRPVLWVSQLEA